MAGCCATFYSRFFKFVTADFVDFYLLRVIYCGFANKKCHRCFVLSAVNVTVFLGDFRKMHFVFSYCQTTFDFSCNKVMMHFQTTHRVSRPLRSYYVGHLPPNYTLALCLTPTSSNIKLNQPRTWRRIASTGIAIKLFRHWQLVTNQTATRLFSVKHRRKTVSMDSTRVI